MNELKTCFLDGEMLGNIKKKIDDVHGKQERLKIEVQEKHETLQKEVQDIKKARLFEQENQETHRAKLQEKHEILQQEVQEKHATLQKELQDIKAARQSEKDNIIITCNEETSNTKEPQTKDDHDPEEIMDEMVKEWSKFEDFFQTKAYRTIREFFQQKDNNIVVIVGNPGSGRRTKARQLALNLQKEKYSVYPVEEPEEVKRYHKRHKLQVFVFEDPIGESSIIVDNLRKWERYNNVLKKATELSDTKIIVTLRPQITNDKAFQTAATILSSDKYHKNINSKDLRLTQNERVEMLRHYCNNRKVSLPIITLNYASICDHDTFPLLCHMYASNPNESLGHIFNNPGMVWQDLFTKMQEHEKTQFVGLVICAIIDKLHSRDFEGSDNAGHVDKARRVIMNEILKYHGCDCNVQTVKEKLDLLENVYIRHTQGTYRFVHIIMKDEVLRVFGEKWPGAIFGLFPMVYLTCVYIKGRYRRKTLVKRLIINEQCGYLYRNTLTALSPFSLEVDTCYIVHMRERVLNDFLENRMGDVFSNPYIDDRCIQNAILNEIQRADTEFKNRSNAVCFSIRSACYELFYLLVQHGFSVNKTIDVQNQRTALFEATNHSEYGIVEFLLQNKANIDKETLNLAVRTGQLHFLRLFFDHDVNANNITFETLIDAFDCGAFNRNGSSFINCLMKSGLDINKCHNGLTVLDLANIYQQHEVISFLIRNEAKSGFIMSLYEKCNAVTRMDCVHKLLRSLKNILHNEHNLIHKIFDKPYDEDTTTSDIMIQAFQGISIANKINAEVLLDSVSLCHIKLSRLLFECGFKLGGNSVDHYYIPAITNNTEMIKLLLQYKTPLFKPSIAVMIKITNEDVEILELLFNNGGLSVVDIPITYLLSVVMYERSLSLYIKHGLDVNRCYNGLTLLDIANLRGAEHSVKILEKSEAKPGLFAAMLENTKLRSALNTDIWRDFNLNITSSLSLTSALNIDIWHGFILNITSLLPAHLANDVLNKPAYETELTIRKIDKALQNVDPEVKRNIKYVLTAVRVKHTKLLSMLLNMNFTAECVNEETDPLTLAVRNQDKRSASILLDFKVKVHQSSINAAIELFDINMLKLFILHGSTFEGVPFVKIIGRPFYIMLNKPTLLQVLTDGGIDVNKCHNGLTLLDVAVIYSKQEIYQQLLSFGAKHGIVMYMFKETRNSLVGDSMCIDRWKAFLILLRQMLPQYLTKCVFEKPFSGNDGIIDNISKAFSIKGQNDVIVKTFIRICVQIGHIRILRIILNKDISFNKDHNELLCLAITNLDYEIVKILLGVKKYVSQNALSIALFQKTDTRMIELVIPHANVGELSIQTLMESILMKNNIESPRNIPEDAKRNILQLLIEHGLQPNINGCHNGVSLLDMASIRGLNTIKDTLLKAGAKNGALASISHNDPLSETLIDLGKYLWLLLNYNREYNNLFVYPQDNCDNVTFLFEKALKGVTPILKCDPTLVYLAASSGHTQLLQMALKAGFSLNGVTQDTDPLFVSVVRMNMGIVKILLKQGANTQSYTIDASIYSGHLRIIKLLLKEKRQVDQISFDVLRDLVESIAIGRLSQSKVLSIFKILIGSGLNVNMCQKGLSLLDVAEICCFKDIVKELKEHQALHGTLMFMYGNAKEYQGIHLWLKLLDLLDTILEPSLALDFFKCPYSKLSKVNDNFEKAINAANASFKNNPTVVDIAVEMQHTSLVSLLVKSKFSIGDVFTNAKQLPLNSAIYLRNHKIAEVLLSHTSVITRHSLDVALINEDNRMVELLINYNANINVCSNYLCASRSKQFLQWLIHKGLNVNKCEIGLTIPDYAFHKNDIRKMLERNGGRHGPLIKHFSGRKISQDIETWEQLIQCIGELVPSHVYEQIINASFYEGVMIDEIGRAFDALDKSNTKSMKTRTVYELLQMHIVLSDQLSLQLQALKSDSL